MSRHLPCAIAPTLLDRPVSDAVLRSTSKDKFAGPAGQHLGYQHRDTVEVRPLFAIDFDMDEPVVHEFGDFRIGVNQVLSR